MRTSSRLGYAAARGVIDLGREAFFPGQNDDLPESESRQISSDDRLPQFGYVGSNYLGRRVLLLGINPGNGPRASRNLGDEVMMPHLERFAADPTEANFAKAQDAYKQACQTWFIWGRACNELLSAANLSIEDVAFSNALPWRTKSEARFSRAVERATADNYVKPLLLDLQPQILVAVGKKVQCIIKHAGETPHVTWNRAHALTQSVRAERELACSLFRELVSS